MDYRDDSALITAARQHWKQVMQDMPKATAKPPTVSELLNMLASNIVAGEVETGDTEDLT